MISHSLDKELKEAVAREVDSVIRAWGAAIVDVQIELINTLLREKAISAYALQAMLDNLVSLEYDQPPVTVPERLRRKLIPELSDAIREKTEWRPADL